MSLNDELVDRQKKKEEYTIPGSGITILCAVGAALAVFFMLNSDNYKMTYCILYAVSAAMSVFIIGGVIAAFTISDTLKDIRSILLKQRDQKTDV